MVVLWVLGWGVGFGGIMEAFVDRDGKIGDIWPMMLAMPGLIGGILFEVLVLVAEGGRRYDLVPLYRVGLWGAVTGVALGLLSIPTEVGDVSPGALRLTGLAVFLSTVTALVSAAVFRLLALFAGRMDRA